MIQKKGQAFKDGLVTICRLVDLAKPGDRPKEGLAPKETLRFHRRTVGMKRYYTAMQANQQVDAVIRCPFRDTVTAQDVAVLEGKQYRVTLVQRPEGIAPPVMDLTLSRLERNYGFTESETGALDGGRAGLPL